MKMDLLEVALNMETELKIPIVELIASMIRGTTVQQMTITSPTKEEMDAYEAALALFKKNVMKICAILFFHNLRLYNDLRYG